MGKIKLRHYAVRKGRGYWLVTPKMREHGFENVRCGADGPDAWRVAEEWEARWQAARRGVAPSQRKVYPRASIGDGFERYRHTGAWASKKPRSREDWDRGWKYIEPFFADQRPASITFEMLDKWYFAIKAKKGTGEAGRAMKTWRALYNVLADMKLCSKGQDPSLSIRRESTPGRTETWSEGEAVRLATYVAQLGFELHEDAPIFRTRGLPQTTSKGGRARSGVPYTSDTLGDDFRDLRRSVFGPGEGRMLMDMRRSGAVESLAGGATAEAISAKLANSLDKNKELQRTYLPVDPATVQTVDEARKRGRHLLRGEQKTDKKLKLSGLKS